VEISYPYPIDSAIISVLNQYAEQFFPHPIDTNVIAGARRGCASWGWRAISSARGCLTRCRRSHRLTTLPNSEIMRCSCTFSRCFLLARKRTVGADTGYDHLFWEFSTVIGAIQSCIRDFGAYHLAAGPRLMRCKISHRLSAPTHTAYESSHTGQDHSSVWGFSTVIGAIQPITRDSGTIHLRRSSCCHRALGPRLGDASYKHGLVRR